MNHSGFIIYKRSRMSTSRYINGIFDEERALFDLVLMAAHKPVYRTLEKGYARELQKGELVASYRFLSQRWNWNKSRVQRFITRLGTEGEIAIGTAVRTPKDIGSIMVITICKYDDYDFDSYVKLQAKKRNKNTPIGTPLGTTVGTRVGTNTKNKRIKEERESENFSLSQFSKDIFNCFRNQHPAYVESIKDKEKIEDLADVLTARYETLNKGKEATNELLKEMWTYYIKNLPDYYISKPIHIIIDNIEEIANKIAMKKR